MAMRPPKPKVTKAHGEWSSSDWVKGLLVEEAWVWDDISMGAKGVAGAGAGVKGMCGIRGVFLSLGLEERFFNTGFMGVIGEKGVIAGAEVGSD